MRVRDGKSVMNERQRDNEWTRETRNEREGVKGGGGGRPSERDNK